MKHDFNGFHLFCTHCGRPMEDEVEEPTPCDRKVYDIRAAQARRRMNALVSDVLKGMAWQRR